MALQDTFRIKRGDTSPSLERALTESGAAVDLTMAASVGLVFAESDGGVPLSGTAVSRSASFVNRAAGQVRYDWVSDDTASAGEFLAEFEVKFADGRVRTFPENDYIRVSIAVDLGAQLETSAGHVEAIAGTVA